MACLFALGGVAPFFHLRGVKTNAVHALPRDARQAFAVVLQMAPHAIVHNRMLDGPHNTETFATVVRLPTVDAKGCVHVAEELDVVEIGGLLCVVHPNDTVPHVLEAHKCTTFAMRLRIESTTTTATQTRRRVGSRGAVVVAAAVRREVAGLRHHHQGAQGGNDEPSPTVSAGARVEQALDALPTGPGAGGGAGAGGSGGPPGLGGVWRDVGWWKSNSCDSGASSESSR